jgi:hypothetical protein
MADVKISELTANSSPAGADVVPVSNSAGTATNKVTLQNVADLADPATIGAVGSDASGISGASVITNAVFLSQASYDAISSPSSSTLYVIT